jgi:hypothetical protein
MVHIEHHPEVHFSYWVQPGIDTYLFQSCISGLAVNYFNYFVINLIEVDQYFDCSPCTLSTKIAWFVLVSFLADLSLVVHDCNNDAMVEHATSNRTGRRIRRTGCKQ